MATRKISYSIVRLNRFAEKAERGERIFDDNAFPNDELGSIASHIVRLYVQRDERHREAMSQEKDKIRLKKQLTNNINHELKTPVASMLVCLDLLREFPNLSMEKKRIFFDRLCANAQRLNSLLKDVSVITRMDEGERMIEKGPVAVDRIVNDVVVEERLRTDMSIIADVPPLVVNGNSGLLESVFRNLIDNAISYSGGTEIRISADSKGNISLLATTEPEFPTNISPIYSSVSTGSTRVGRVPWEELGWDCPSCETPWPYTAELCVSQTTAVCVSISLFPLQT